VKINQKKLLFITQLLSHNSVTVVLNTVDSAYHNTCNT